MSSMKLVIDKALQNLPEEKIGKYCEYYESDLIVTRGKQQFALFKSTAYQLCRRSDEDLLVTPVVINGKIWGQFPNEGSSGVLHLFYRKDRKRWGTCFTHGGWLRKEELKLTNEEISRNITEEILAGNNVLTTPPPGWA